MITIKNSYGNCSKCPLLNNPSVTNECSVFDNIKDNIDIIIVDESPTWEDCLNRNNDYIDGTPMIDRRKNKFRTLFERSILNLPRQINYIVTNNVLCTLSYNNKQHILDNKILDCCKPNLDALIDICKPQVIIAIGESNLKTFNIKDDIEKSLNKIYNYNGIQVIMFPSLTSGSYLLSSDNMQKIFNNVRQIMIENHDIDLSELMQDLEINDDDNGIDKNYFHIDEKTNTCMFKMNPKYMNGDYRLVDIQYVNQGKKLIYIYRDKDNVKLYDIINMPQTNFYYYRSKNTSDKNVIEKFENLELEFCNYTNRNDETVFKKYENDMRLAEKHSYDYYLQIKNECDVVKSNIMFFDIEVYTGKQKIFPDPIKAKFPINCVSFAVDDGEIYTYLLNFNNIISDKLLNEIKSKFKNLKIFNDESTLIMEFIDVIHKIDPDFLSGWNSNGFDIPYLYNRCKKLKINKSLSKFGNPYIDKNMCDIPGIICHDLLWLFKELSQNKEASYKLENIAQAVLGRGKKKYKGNLNTLYEDDIILFCEYSITDVDLLKGIHSKKHHLEMFEQLRKEACTTHKGASSTLGQADGLFYHELKLNGYSMQEAAHSVKTPFPGAYVRNPTGGIFDWVGDFDFTSMYPKDILSRNIGPNTYIAKIDHGTMHDYIYNKTKWEKDKQNNIPIEIILNPVYNTTKTLMQRVDFENFVLENNATLSYYGTMFKGHDIEKSFFYNIVSTLFAKRKQYKNEMLVFRENKQPEREKVASNRQWSFKILLNSLYGVLAQEHFRFYNIDLAATITFDGQESIKFAGEHIEAYMHDKDNFKINPNFFTDIEKPKQYLRYCDTDSLFLWMKIYLEKLKMEINVENVIKQLKILQNWINDELLINFAALHRIPKEECGFEMKNELVAKRYYCLNVKKKYALHIISEEEKAVDRIDIKGLENKRSDFSDLTKKMLDKIVEMILSDGFSITEVYNYIEETRKEALTLIKNNDMSIFKSIGMSGEESTYKAMTQNLKAMLTWNMLEYDYFKPGQRGALVPLKSIDLHLAPKNVSDNFYKKYNDKFKGKPLDVVAIPEEEKSIPSYYDINIDKVLSFAIDDRVNILLEPLVKKQDSVLLF